MTPHPVPGRVSVVIPCFNDGVHVREAVDSALDQTRPPVEVIVVDDGSTDEYTVSTLDDVAGDQVKVHRQANQGLSAARNTGIGLASGDYILPLDSDDRISPDYVELAASVLDERPEVGIVGGGIEFFGLKSGRARPTFDGIEGMLFENRLYTCSMSRRVDWEAVQGYPEHVSFAEDWIYWLRILALGREVHLLDETVWFYRQRPGQMTRNMNHRTATSAVINAMKDQPQLYAEHIDEVIAYLDIKLRTLDSFRRRYGRINDAVSGLHAVRKRVTR